MYRGPALAIALILAACTETTPGQTGAESMQHSAGDQPLGAANQRSAAQQAFAEANDRMHAAMSEIPSDADEAFMRGMLAHHRGAVEMAEVELAHGKDEEARDLAQRIIEAQQAEIEEMEAWLEARSIETSPARMPAGMDHAAH
ncbi:CopM family metallochaperone [Methylorubrum thiocyanatum]|uniref:CopM family metallochaperone n=1 Tax=Methylorubrum thiocyanatum TaxID=47958 RepID=UPI0035C87E4B